MQPMQALTGLGWHNFPLSEAAQASFYLIPGDKRLLRIRLEQVIF